MPFSNSFQGRFENLQFTKTIIYKCIGYLITEVLVLEWDLIGVFDAEFVKQKFEIVLGTEASVHKITFYIQPVSESFVIEHLQLFCYDEWNISKTKTFPKHYQSAHSTVSILKRMNCLKSLMEIYDIFKRRFLYTVIFFQQRLNLFVYILRFYCVNAADLIRQFLIIPDIKPVSSLVRCPGYKQEMKMLDKRFREFSFCIVDDVVNCTEVICSFYDVINVNCIVSNSNSVGVEYIACLVVCQSAPFDVVGVVCEINLYTVIDATFCFA